MLRPALLAALAAAFALAPALAVEVKVISANGMREVIADTKDAFEKASGHTLDVTVVETGAIRQRLLSGEAYDVIMLPASASDDMVRLGKIVPDSRVSLIRVNFGLAVRDDGPKPDTGTPEALRNTFLAARRVLITDPSTGGISGVHLMEVLGKLGITDQMRGKLIPNGGGGFHAARVVKGEADLAVQAEHEIKCVRGAAFLEYPKEFQRSIVFFAGIGTDSQNSDAAKSYMTFIKGPQTAAAIKANCLTPG
jgi:molybdate transport system substrate-binding protein